MKKKKGGSAIRQSDVQKQIENLQKVMETRRSALLKMSGKAGLSGKKPGKDRHERPDGEKE